MIHASFLFYLYQKSDTLHYKINWSIMGIIPKPKYTIKQILLSNQNWWRFYETHKDNMRISIIKSIVKLLSCKNVVRGYREYHCSNPSCSHFKRIFFSCKSKACSSCGKKAAEL